MALTKCRLGELIELITETNNNNLFNLQDVQGVTITKQFIPTKADVEGTDLKKFLVIRPQNFVYNPRTHGKHIGFGYNNTNKSFITSWNNVGFRVKEGKKDLILDKYLFLHFNRDEWDRKACYCSWGSSTEVFSWEALCDMFIELPDLPTQQKYVDIYNALVANQQSYERGLDDLKLVCDGFIEDLRRQMPCEKIGKYITESNEKNDRGLTIEHVRGIATSKEFIDTKANMADVPLSNYKIVNPCEIAFISDTSRRGDKVSLALNSSKESFLVSAISTIFKTDQRHLLPEYLLLHFKRDEFDRYARFNSWGSARENFSFEEMQNVEIPIPEISIQQSIVDIYHIYMMRKRINEKLKAQIKNICPILIRGSLEDGSN